MRCRARTLLALVPLACLCATAWGPAPVASVAADPHRADHFLPGDQCAICHSVAPGANAMRSPTGDDVSPHGTWQGTMMANSFHDPYFHAQVQKESKSKGEEVQELCLRCHAPMAHHDAVLNGKQPPRLQDLADNPLADDGVSCTMCHQILPDGLGEAATFSGRPKVGTERKIFGPFPDPATGPMQNQVHYTPTHGQHVQHAGLCGSCHTLITEHQGQPFHEQTPYLEWRNSDFSNEGPANANARTCQQCHMARPGPTRIARNPMGVDFLIPVREGFAAHGFVGGNAFMLDMLREQREELGVTAEPSALARMAAATRRQLGESTARLQVADLLRKGGKLTFTVRVENLTGHKFPTGYPSRRAWLHVQVRSGRQIVFETGNVGEDGRLVGVADEFDLPHRSVVERPDDVVVYEMVADGPDGKPTTYLTQMVGRRKDNRLLPKGWRRDGPHAQETAPVGTDSDVDFVAGGDAVAFAVDLPAGARGRLQVVAWLHYQTVPPGWVDALRNVDAEACRRFVRLYDSADKKPETVAVVVKFEEQ